FQRHFPPLTNRSMFRREPLSMDPPLTSRIEFPFANDEAALRSDLTVHIPSTSGVATTRKPIASIPKPHGEVSRLSRGGYNLEEALGWSKVEYTKVQKGIREIAKDHLDLTSILSEQDSFSGLRTQAKERFPVLEEYQNDWATEDFLFIMLKN
ncbi:hypothetical protein SCHPADRAFT_812803, partial [Schizopora paradoxa]